MVLSGLELFRQLNTALQRAPVKTYRHHAQPCIPSCWLLQFGFFFTHIPVTEERPGWAQKSTTTSSSKTQFLQPQNMELFWTQPTRLCQRAVKWCPEIFGTYDVGRRPSLELIKCLHKCFDLSKTVWLIYHC